MVGVVDKVTALVVRAGDRGHELLLFRHHAGSIQLPSGTVEPGETPEQAVQREAREETGLDGLTITQALGVTDLQLPDDQRVILTSTTVYARPTERSFDWARLRRGLWVRCQRWQAGFVQVTFVEWENLEDPRVVSYQITGWVPEATLASIQRRHFYLLGVAGPTATEWAVDDDGHRFDLFWAPLSALPPLLPTQQPWLAMLPAALGRP